MCIVSDREKRQIRGRGNFVIRCTRGRGSEERNNYAKSLGALGVWYVLKFKTRLPSKSPPPPRIHLGKQYICNK